MVITHNKKSINNLNKSTSSIGIPSIFFKNKSILNFSQLTSFAKVTNSQRSESVWDKLKPSIYGEKLSNRVKKAIIPDQSYLDEQKIQAVKILESKKRKFIETQEVNNLSKRLCVEDSELGHNLNIDSKKLSNSTYHAVFSKPTPKQFSTLSNYRFTRAIDKEYTLRDESFLSNPYLFEPVKTTNSLNNILMNEKEKNTTIFKDREVELQKTEQSVLLDNTSDKVINLKVTNVENLPVIQYKTKSISQLLSEIDNHRLTSKNKKISSCKNFNQRFENIKNLLCDVLPRNDNKGFLKENETVKSTLEITNLQSNNNSNVISDNVSIFTSKSLNNVNPQCQPSISFGKDKNLNNNKIDCTDDKITILESTPNSAESIPIKTDGPANIQSGLKLSLNQGSSNTITSTVFGSLTALENKPSIKNVDKSSIFDNSFSFQKSASSIINSKPSISVATTISTNSTTGFSFDLASQRKPATSDFSNKPLKSDTAVNLNPDKVEDKRSATIVLSQDLKGDIGSTLNKQLHCSPKDATVSAATALFNLPSSSDLLQSNIQSPKSLITNQDSFSVPFTSQNTHGLHNEVSNNFISQSVTPPNNIFGQSVTTSNNMFYPSAAIPNNTFGQSVSSSNSVFGQPLTLSNNALEQSVTSYNSMFNQSVTSSKVTFGQSVASDNMFSQSVISSNNIYNGPVTSSNTKFSQLVTSYQSTTSSNNLFGQSATSSNNTVDKIVTLSNNMFGQTKTSSNDMFGQSVTSSNNMFGQSVTSSNNMFGQSVTSSNNMFGQSVTSSNNMFGQSVTSSNNMFGQSVTSSNNMFGQSVTSSNNMFGQSVTSSNNMFGQSVTSSNNMFGQSVTSSNNMFGQSVTSSNNMFGQSVTSSNNMFGQSVTSSNNMFGQSVTSSNNMFDQSVTSSNNMFGQTVSSSVNAFGQTVSTSNIFGQTSSNPNNLFGQSVPISASNAFSTSNNAFSQPVSAASITFGKSSSTSNNAFGQTIIATSNIFGQPVSVSSNIFGQSDSTPSNTFSHSGSISNNIFGQSTNTISNLFVNSATTAANTFGGQTVSTSSILQGPIYNVQTNSLGQSNNMSVGVHGQSTNGNLFGQSNTQPVGFGQSNSGLSQISIQSSNNLFGQNSNATISPFGQSLANPTNGTNRVSIAEPVLFGRATVTANTNSINLFGQSNGFATKSAEPGIFGNINGQRPNDTNTGFGQAVSSNSTNFVFDKKPNDNNFVSSPSVPNSSAFAFNQIEVKKSSANNIFNQSTPTTAFVFGKTDNLDIDKPLFGQSSGSNSQSCVTKRIDLNPGNSVFGQNDNKNNIFGQISSTNNSSVTNSKNIFTESNKCGQNSHTAASLNFEFNIDSRVGHNTFGQSSDNSKLPNSQNTAPNAFAFNSLSTASFSDQPNRFQPSESSAVANGAFAFGQNQTPRTDFSAPQSFRGNFRRGTRRR